ncbi:hypothetical protein D0A38_05015 [Xanthomonas campestris pv. incanae]|nr:hypothetical protein D0A38_05015 [Xanthomonas campestris pv. incanae]
MRDAMATVGGRSVPTDEAVIGWRYMLHGMHACRCGHVDCRCGSAMHARPVGCRKGSAEDSLQAQAAERMPIHEVVRADAATR